MISVSRRIAYIGVPEHVILDLIFAKASEIPNRVNVAVFEKLPEGSKLLGVVQHDWQNRMFYFLVENEKFDKVPDGCHIDRVHPGLGLGNLMMHSYKIMKEPTGFPDPNEVYIPDFTTLAAD